MAVALLTANVKFLKLVRRLGLPVPYVRGLLDTMWDVCHANADPHIGDAEGVEAAAQWPGEPGVLFAALQGGGWLDPDPEREGEWLAHDYFEHCPNFVLDRLQKREYRKRARAVASEKAGTVPKKSRTVRAVGAKGEGQGGDCPRTVPGLSPDSPRTISENRPPAPAPAPTPDKEKEKEHTPSSPSATTATEPGYSPAFLSFWSEYPKKVGKGDAWKVWKRLRLDPLVPTIVLAIRSQRVQVQWKEEGGRFIPNPSTWLNQRRWEDEVKSLGEVARGVSSVGRSIEPDTRTPEEVEETVEHLRKVDRLVYLKNEAEKLGVDRLALYMAKTPEQVQALMDQANGGVA